MEIKDVYRGDVAPNDPHLIWVRGTEILLFGKDGWQPLSGSLSTLEKLLSEDSVNPIQNSAVYRQYMTEDDILDIPIIFDSIYRNMPLTFKILSDGNIVWKATDAAAVKTIEYSKNGGEWTSITSTTAGVSIPVVKGDEVQFRGDNAGYAVKVGTAWKRSVFSDSTCEFDIEGNIMSLIDSENFGILNEITGDACFINMFGGNPTGCKIINAKNLYLPATILTEQCYCQLFIRCTTLKTAPRILPAEELPEKAYTKMFQECGIISTPKIMAKIVGVQSCGSMFYDCQSLNKAYNLLVESCDISGLERMFIHCINLVEIPKRLNIPTIKKNACKGMFALCLSIKETPEICATTIEESGCDQMFAGCESLEVVNSINAETIGKKAFYAMFGPTNISSYYNEQKCCKSLKIIPSILPATTLGNECYASMFLGCSSLRTVPILPATTLSENCYEAMFAGCENLETVPELPATTLARCCYSSMFASYYYTIGSIRTLYPATKIKESPILPAKTLAEKCYEYMFCGCINLNKITCYATDISATDCTTDWVDRVAPKGTFTKIEGVEWTTGVNGIPERWTVEEAVNPE